MWSREDPYFTFRSSGSLDVEEEMAITWKVCGSVLRERKKSKIGLRVYT